MTYFSRIGHVGLLAGVSLITYGLGGLLYWLLRRKDTICPSCGLSWKGHGLLITDGPESNIPARPAAETIRLPRGGAIRRFLGVTMVLGSLVLLGIGLAEWQAVVVTVGAVVGAAGALSFGWGWRALQFRREALLQGLQQRVLHLAEEAGGTLTVTEVANRLGLGLPAAERVLISLDDGFRVRSEITDQGLLLYDFPELRRRALPGAGSR